MPKGDVSGVIGAKARTAHRHPVTIAFAPCEIEYVVDDDIFVSVVRPHTISGMNALVVEAVQVDRVRAVNSDLSRINIASHGIDQTEIFILIVTTERGREKN